MKKKVSPANSRKLDQFYTNPVIAHRIMGKIATVVDMDKFDVMLEPSAGTGSFYDLMDPERRIGIDIDPKFPGIYKGDFLTWDPHSSEKSFIAIGNPPFGKNSSLAVKFFNRCALFCDVIAFILPKTFRKASLINRLAKSHHLIYDMDVPKDSFIFDGNTYDVPCCFQIWKKEPVARAKIEVLSFGDVKEWFELSTPDAADFSVQRVGQKAGTIRSADFRHYSPLSHYFIKSKHDWVLSVFEKLDFNDVKFNTAGNPSISPGELIFLWISEARKEKLIG